jgi:O-6-methylguanine DNA methyltransferase
MIPNYLFITMHKQPLFLTSCSINTPLGTMTAVADENTLYLLDFSDSKYVEQHIDQLHAKIEPGTNKMLTLITTELNDYFAGNLKSFTTPVRFTGTSFQQKSWQILLTIEYGQTRSYAQEAMILGNKNAYRAVATNKLAIIIPCHRIIANNGTLCGYAGGIERKKWLLEHEQKNTHNL